MYDVLDMPEIRDLLEEEVESLKGVPKTTRGRLERISSRHHALARYLARGFKTADAAILAGYATGTVSSLQSDPSFIELVQFYQGEENDKLRALQEKMLGIGLEAAELLQKKLEEEPEKLTTAVLLQVMQVMADRTGNGPSQKVEHSHTHDIATRLQAAQRRLEQSNVITIEGKKNDD